MDRDEAEPYYFESDHVALKENADYNKLLRVMTILEAQREQAAQDLESLYKAQDEALADPLKFVKKLQNGEQLDFAKPQQIVPLPDIQWEKYTSSVNFSSFVSRWPKTRQKRQHDETLKGVDAIQKLKKSLLGQGSASSTSSSNGSSSDAVVVRGRTKDVNKPASFNKLWTSEEQQKLEFLLVKFPPEEVEARRWAKIAEAMGNRTPIQVASRVQKYFVSLAKEGLPVPGRMPNLSSYGKKSSHRHQRYKRSYYQSSTLLQSHLPPVWMTDDNQEKDYNLPGCSTGSFGSASPANSESNIRAFDTIPNCDQDLEDSLYDGLRDDPEYKELMELQQIKRESVQETEAGGVHSVCHFGYKCDSCSMEPLVGTRWHCMDCPKDVSFDFCDSCSVLPFQEGMHNSSHRLQPIKNVVLDSDYMHHTKSNYNYLDSNYMPGS